MSKDGNTRSPLARHSGMARTRGFTPLLGGGAGFGYARRFQRGVIVIARNLRRGIC